MKYKNVFLIWLWANLILIVAAFVLINLHYYIKEEMSLRRFGHYESTRLIVFVGFVFTIPSLILMLFFHLIYSKNKSDVTEYLKLYCVLILSINIIYLFVCKLFLEIDDAWNGPITPTIICIITSAAGLAGLYIEHKKIKKRIIN